jgi:Mn-dependent transcriptional regulator
MKIQESAENYLESILMLSKTKPNVRSIDIAVELNYTKPSVSVAMKKLRENGYIMVDIDGHITLTEAGLEIAEKMYERHKFLTDFLVKVGVSKEIAANDACRIEHVLSAESFEKIKEYVNKES